MMTPYTLRLIHQHTDQEHYTYLDSDINVQEIDCDCNLFKFNLNDTFKSDIFQIEDYKLPFFGMLVMNFVFPVLLLMNSDYKRVNWFVVMAGIVILAGHYVDVFNMVMPGTVGASWFIGLPEIGSVLFFLGLFIFVVIFNLYF